MPEPATEAAPEPATPEPVASNGEDSLNVGETVAAEPVAVAANGSGEEETAPKVPSTAGS